MFIKIFNEITGIKYRHLLLLVPLLFGIAAIYAYYLFITPAGMLQHIQTILFITILLIIALYNIYFIFRTNDIFSTYWIIPVVYTLAIHFGLLLGIALSGYGANALWVTDSYTTHVPGSINITHFLQGTDNIHRGDSIFDKVYFTHILVGIFFYAFGANIFASALALLVAKLACVFIIFYLAMQIFNNTKIAAIAIITYVFMPEILFHTIIFYREAVVELIVAMTILSIYMVFIKKNYSIKWIILLIFSLLLIANERFYILPLFIIAIIIYLMISKDIGRVYKVGSVTAAFLGLFAFLGYYLHSHFENVPVEVAFWDIFEEIYKIRLANNSPDMGVNPINLSLPYPLAVIKETFTPYFSISKFATYINLTELLNWGAILNQIVVVLFIIGVVVYAKKERNILLLVLPFILLMFLYGYLGPYNSRVRDSFYPLIAIFAAYAMYTIVLYYQVNKKNKIFIHKEDV